ncbi:hypothetical protein RhiirA5_386305 [Rhizophagus irregularis]|uniref:Uncharacterized protein n=1 Tax=Rhizophagus irregularis TaxID=588596 RepID=A0A2N0NKA5_9GLOM|nr:hypothetical protein RhiirA5_386305 [Rhizophagus irregularis]
MTDSDALPLSDEYYTESGDISDTGTIENTYEAAEQDTSGQSSFILNPFNWGNKPQHPTLPNNFIYIVHDTSGANKGTGVAIMITDKMEKHLNHTEFLEGQKTFFDSRNKHLFEKFMDVLPFNKRNDEVKKVFKYDQMTVELWSSYTNRSRSTFKNRFSKEPQQINNKTTLNRQWDLFEKTLIELKEHIIPQKSINFNTSSNPDLPLELRQMNNHVILLYQVKQFLNLKHIKIRFKLNFTPTPSTVHNIPQHIWVTYYEGWMKYLPRLKILLDFNKLPIILPLTVTPDNFISTKDEIYRLFHMMKIAYQSAYDKYLSNKISSYVTERNDNLQHDQTKMINSILNRKPHRIVLDRLSFIDNKGEHVFTNNPEIIEKEAIKHFQHQAGPQMKRLFGI